MKNINNSSIFITNLPFFHFFSFASSINKLVIFWTLSSLFYLINNCVFDNYELISKRSRQKGKISPNLLFTISRQISKFVKILYIKDPLNQTEWTEDIMTRGTEVIKDMVTEETKGTEYVKDKVTDEHIRGGNRGIG